MASRKQKIKEKREKEKQMQRQIQIGAASIGALILIAIIVYSIVQSGVFDPPPVDLAELEANGTLQQICNDATPAITGGQNGQYAQAPDMQLDAGVDYQAIFCTSAGPIYIDLFEDRTPVTVNNFVFLATNNYYNNTQFHRVLDGFMAQGGDPTGTGTGGPGYQFQDEVFPDDNFDRPGLLAMANAGPGTNGSQFFITLAPTDWLNGRHTIFGEVLSGQENVSALQRIDPQQPNPAIMPSDLEAVVIVTPEQVSQ
ncbi:MAG: peptidylprolyl isomerase [Chloroflexota bacterium]